MVIYIPLSQNGKKHKDKYVAIVDDDDKILASFRWNVLIDNDTEYARRSVGNKTIMLHQMVLEHMLGRPLESGEYPDHIDGNGLNNQRRNLRKASREENMQNSRKRKDNKSGVKGISWKERNQKWQARINVNGKQYYLGLFATLDAAKEAWEKAASEFHKEFKRR